MSKAVHNRIVESGKKPLDSEILVGEMVINDADEVIYSKKEDGTIYKLGGGSINLPYTDVPILVCDTTSINELSTFEVVIENFSETAVYTINTTYSTFTRTAGVITIDTLEIEIDVSAEVTVAAFEESYLISPVAKHSFTILDVPAIEDQSLVYDTTTMYNFEKLTNVAIVNDSLVSKPIDTTNIILNAVDGSFDTSTAVYDGDVLNIDGVDTVITESSSGESIVSSTDPFNDGSLIAKYELDGNTNDTTGNYDGTATDVTYTHGKFGDAGVFNGSSSYIDVSPASSNLYVSFRFKVYTTSNSQGLLNNGDTGFTETYKNARAYVNSDGVLRVGSAYVGDIDIAQINIDTWYSLIIDKTGDSFLVYLNEEDVHSFTFETTNETGNIYIGASTFGNSKVEILLNGELDQVEFYNQPSTTERRAFLYTQNRSTVPTVGTATTAYINMHRAITDEVVQEEGETDFNGLTSSISGGEPFEAEFEFVNIANGSEVDLLKTSNEIKDGDNLIIIKDDNSINEVIVDGVYDDITNAKHDFEDVLSDSEGNNTWTNSGGVFSDSDISRGLYLSGDDRVSLDYVMPTINIIDTTIRVMTTTIGTDYPAYLKTILAFSGVGSEGEDAGIALQFSNNTDKNTYSIMINDREAVGVDTLETRANVFTLNDYYVVRLVIDISDKKIKLYVNNVLEIDTFYTGDLSNLHRILLGNETSHEAYPLDGMVDSIKVYVDKYTLNTSSVTNGETPSRVFSVDTKLKFKIGE